MTKHIKRAYAQIKTNKEESLIDSSLEAHFKEVNYTNWVDKQRSTYAKLHPDCREPTKEELEEQYKMYLHENTGLEETVEENDFIGEQIKIGYDYWEWIKPVQESGHYEEEEYIIDTVAVDGYYKKENKVPTLEQWMEDKVYEEVSVEEDKLNFKTNSEEYIGYCIEYMKSTDWVVTRKMEMGIEIPIEIKKKREEIRKMI